MFKRPIFLSLHIWEYSIYQTFKSIYNSSEPEPVLCNGIVAYWNEKIGKIANVVLFIQYFLVFITPRGTLRNRHC